MKRNKFDKIVPAGLLLWAAMGGAGVLSAADEFQQRVQPFARKYCVKCHNDRKARGELNIGGYQTADQVVRDFRRWSHIIDFIRRGEMPPAEAQQPTPKERTRVVAVLQQILLEQARKNAGDPGIVPPRRLSNTEYDLSVRDLTGVDIRPTRSFPVDPAGGEGFDNTGEALSMSPSLLKKYLAAAQHVSQHLVLKTEGISFAPFPVASYNERKKLVEQAIIDFYQRHDVRISDYLEAAWRFRYRKASDRRMSVEAWADRQGLSAKYLALVWKTLEQASAGDGYLKHLGRLWRAVPAPRIENLDAAPGRASPIPPELSEVKRFVEHCQTALGHRRQSLIRSNAGNWPISHLDFRARTAVSRDQFDATRLQGRRLIRFDPIRTDRKDKGEQTLYLRIDREGDHSNPPLVLIRRPLFSKSGKLPRNEKDEAKHAVVTLRSVLEKHAPAVARRLAFGQHPRGEKIGADSFVLRAPAQIEIPLSAELRRQLDRKQLLMQCELDQQSGQQAFVRVSRSAGAPRAGYASGDILLFHQGGKAAQAVADSAKRICFTFPNRFFYVDDKRGLAAGFHLVEGFFRDDRPLCEKVLDQSALRELDRLWQQLDFVTNRAETLLRGFVWFERSERHVLHDKRFDFLRPEDPKLTDPKLLERFERLYLERLGVKLLEGKTEPRRPSDKFNMIHGFFEQLRRDLKRQTRLLKSAEQKGLLDLQDVARKAYGRPLRGEETRSLTGLHRKLRAQGQSVEDSLRGVFTAILMSPDFCYRFHESPPSSRVHPLSGHALASRLSYFLWSSLPDEALLAAATRGSLSDEDTLRSQTRRMLKSSKMHAFAREFFGQWLRYRDYLSNDSIDTGSYPGYTEPLRRAMFEEPSRLATYLIQKDRSILELLDSDVTFVNRVLARHYGPAITAQYNRRRARLPSKQRSQLAAGSRKSDDIWLRVDGLRGAGRGGLFGMGVILTKNSAGARTSPVKRGFWAVHHLLGQHFPPPPTDVPELPPNEKEADQTIRRLIAVHTANRKCAICHVHFDSLGMTLEGFDAIGRTRTKDLAGRPIDDRATLPGGRQAKGVGGLIDYVKKHRRQEFVRTFCRKFLGYALGRSLVLSDQPLLNQMEATLQKNDFRFSVLFEVVVSSRQFRFHRGRESSATKK